MNDLKESAANSSQARTGSRASRRSKESDANVNPKIIHRIYFPNFKPFKDPFLHYLESWQREMPDYKIKLWGPDNLPCDENEWVRRAAAGGAPVFLAEYYRWKVLSEFGGIYLDADCEIVDGKILNELIDDLYSQDVYDVFFGVEERSNGHPTAQTVAAKPGSELVQYMKSLYENVLPSLWEWRERRGLIGPQLMALYFLDKGINIHDDGLFKWLDEPVVIERAKVYPQTYFSPKFSLNGDSLAYEPGKTCIYHMFANSNVEFVEDSKEALQRRKALTFAEYRNLLEAGPQIPVTISATDLPMRAARVLDGRLTADGRGGLLSFGPYISLRAGTYVASLTDARLPINGFFSLSITSNGGRTQIARREFDLEHGPGTPAEVTFKIDTQHNRVEVLVEASEKTMLSYSGVRIDHGDELGQKSSLKKLHRIYFGFDGRPDPFLRYLDTWKKHLPDFEVYHWNASNLPVNLNAYTTRLFNEQNHAFLTDYFRWYVLREYGGTYLDADVELVNGDLYRELIEDLDNSTEFDAFIGIDEKAGGWYTAHSMASKPQSKLSRFMCYIYEDLHRFIPWLKFGFYLWAPQLTALYFSNGGHNITGMGTTPNLNAPIVVDRVKIYPQDWFSPIAPTGKPDLPFNINAVTRNTSLCHHFACSWHDASSIYTQHSKSRGGQASILLFELLNDLQHGSFDFTSGLRTAVGMLIDGSVSTTGKEGFLVFGPYINLPAGRYSICIHFLKLETARDMIVEVVAEKGEINIAKFFGSNLLFDEDKLRFEIELQDFLADVEFRVYVSARTVITVKSIDYNIQKGSRPELKPPIELLAR